METEPKKEQEASQTTNSQNELKQVTDLDERELYGAMSYVFILVLIPFLKRKDDPFVNFHIRQGMVVSIGFVLAIIIAAFNSMIGSLLFFVLFVGNVVALVLALQGRRWKIPFIGTLAEKIRV